MAGMLQEMQSRCESYYTQHSKRLNKIERRLLNTGPPTSATQASFVYGAGGNGIGNPYLSAEESSNHTCSFSDISDNSYEIMAGEDNQRQHNSDLQWSSSTSNNSGPACENHGSLGASGNPF